MKFPNILASFLLITSVIMLGFSGCKKYEEDDYWFTLRSPLKRVTGKHEIVEFMIDGIDSLTYFKNRYGEFYIDFTKEMNSQEDYILKVFSKGSDIMLFEGIWTFPVSTEQFYFEFEQDMEKSYSSGEFNIKKLTNNEIHLDAPRAFLNIRDTTLSKTISHITIKLLKK